MIRHQWETVNFKSIGKDVTVYPWSRIVRPEVITLGDSVIIDDFVFLDGGLGVTIGSFIHIAAGAMVMGGGVFVMEDFCALSGGVRVYTGHEDYTGEYLTNPSVPEPYRHPERLSVVMRKHALIGAGSVVLAGVEIGEGASVGALSLVNKDLEPWTVYVGVPARPLKPRNKERMLELEERLRHRLYKDGRYIPIAERMTP